ncbi:CAP domain-containing protein [uncultured Roseobacter sp.]|uniref:CAP domain-containing protein n=1 Tax=uncultured Roseobacter sp. TaxID=114847 RepID=UPI00263413D8|nr:CAP domain-containing protein [uncultured Roseobacter sp.]
MSRASDLERQMLDLINEERTSRGLDPVELELRLNDSSEDHSQWMLEEDRFSHTGEGGSSAGERMRDANFDFDGNWTWGENIAYQSERGAPGLADDVEDLHDSLMNSPGHRANILNPDFEVVGLGIEMGDFNGFDAVMVTQNFAATDAELQLDAGTATSPEEVDDTSDPQPDPEDPVAEAPEPETEDPVAEAPEPAPETPEEPVAEAPGPEPEEPEEPIAETPEEPVAEAPEPDPEAPEEPIAEAPEPEAPEPEEPVAEAPEPEPETPDMPDPDTPDDGDESPVGKIDSDTFAQLQFFVTGFLATLFDDDFTFTWTGGDEPQTVTFNIDELFDELFNGSDDGSDMDDDDMMLAQDDTAGDGGSGFQFMQDWDCLA